jgi:hypothetical protein
MRQINVPVEDAVYEAAKIASARRGMLFRKFIERAVLDALEPRDMPDRKRGPGVATELVERDRELVPFDEV